MQSYLDSLDEELSNQPGFKKPPTKIVRKCRTTSQTDPDSGYINHGSKRGIGYLMEATVDCKHGILTGVDVYSANEKESLLVLRHLERQINLGIPYLRCYQVEGDACMRCPKRPSCFDKAGIRRRVLASSCYPAFFRGHQRVGTPEYLAMMRLRKIWAEGSFSVLKREHCIS